MLPMFHLWLNFPVLLGNFGTTFADEVPNNLAFIQGYPCSELDVRILKSEKTPFPRECDQLCSRSGRCESFTWSRTNSSCVLFATTLQKECFVRDDNQFWFAKNFAAHRGIFSDYVILTKSNGYGGLGVDPLSPFRNCIVHDAKIWFEAKQTCSELGLKLFSPKNLDQFSMIQSRNCAAIPNEDLWTGYYRDPNNVETGDISYASEDLRIFPGDPMWSKNMEFGGKECVLYSSKQQENSLVVENCAFSFKFVCIDDSFPRTCANNGNVPVGEELLRLASFGPINGNYYQSFLSTAPCEEKHATFVGSSTYVDETNFNEVQRVARLVEPNGNFDDKIALKLSDENYQVLRLVRIIKTKQAKTEETKLTEETPGLRCSTHDSSDTVEPSPFLVANYNGRTIIKSNHGSNRVISLLTAANILKLLQRTKYFGAGWFSFRGILGA